jgi:mannose-1-phosphate guanylyltransferase/mannose-6-phosphate isomerase
MNCAIILAGGTGTRFWPLSRQLEPKQFLSICSNRPMIEETIGRVLSLVKRKNIYIATNRSQVKKIAKYVKRLNIPARNLFLEAEAKNTFAPIAVLSRMINNKHPDAVMVVLPSDHFVKNKKKFIGLLARAIKIAHQGYLVTMGIPPDRPETGYGYIKIGKRRKDFYLAQEFIEKPQLLSARKFIKEKGYYWNSGIFIFKPGLILEEIKRLMPTAYSIITRIKNKKDIGRLWFKLPCVSFDYAIMERTDKAAVLPADYGWSDLGCWRALDSVMRKDRNGNIFRGACVDLGSKNSFIWSDKVVATLGLDNLVVVDTRDALLVCHKDRTQDVKKIVEILKRRNFKEQI